MNVDGIGQSAQGPDLKRLMLAVVLMTGVLMAYNTFFAPTPLAPVATAEKIESVASPKAEIVNPGIVAPARLDGTPDNLPAQITTIDGSILLGRSLGGSASEAKRGNFQVQISSVGAQITLFGMPGFHKPVTLVDAQKSGLGLFGLASRDNSVALSPLASFVVKQTGVASAEYERLSSEGVRFLRRFNIDREKGIIAQELEVRNESGAKQRLALDVLLANPALASSEVTEFTGAGGGEIEASCRSSEQNERWKLADLAKGKQTLNGAIQYAGFEDRYFAGVLVAKGAPFVGCTWEAQDEIVKNASGSVLRLHLQPVELAAGATKTWSFSSYVGPKQADLLKQADPGLVDMINFGWFGAIARPMLWMLEQIFGFVGNFGLAIILLTFLIKLLTYPLTQKSFVSMQEMKKIGPELKDLQKKYGHDRMMLSQKQMELYKTKGINPMSGCLPLLIQMPIWFALYQMLWNSVELYQQPFFGWITDLTQADHFYVLPVAMGISMAVQQMFQPVPEDQPQMKYVMWAMPVFLTFVMLKMPSGLSLYIFTNNILTIAQQYLIKRRYA